MGGPYVTYEHGRICIMEQGVLRPGTDFAVELRPDDLDHVDVAVRYPDGTTSAVTVLADAVIEHPACVSSGTLRWSPSRSVTAALASRDRNATVLSLGLPLEICRVFQFKAMMAGRIQLRYEDPEDSAYSWHAIEVEDDMVFTYVDPDSSVHSRTHLPAFLDEVGSSLKCDVGVTLRLERMADEGDLVSFRPVHGLCNVHVHGLSDVSTPRHIFQLDGVASHLRPDPDLLDRVNKSRRGDVAVDAGISPRQQHLDRPQQ
ncbi:uncharacterized protein PFL1_05304 [Pseudozyma flocculosa PF-1]|uniref:Uncharacterized protein n=2 Tax=Pseudozyma flocculosa TaxID=84751 RepID=A0A5C3FCY4_9BASI|nr:uncharacterized protein PFL1_05304 [Pseudozyma flocculosa PF-1]EPQ27020.1 hypothetical protein PFL1_05304 [Pseudozyma flocculosa PF-1]SPO42016.1 uncharacterized protein PSFLO_07499 [Pseudozyma flocculosa]